MGITPPTTEDMEDTLANTKDSGITGVVVGVLGPIVVTMGIRSVAVSDPDSTTEVTKTVLMVGSDSGTTIPPVMAGEIVDAAVPSPSGREDSSPGAFIVVPVMSSGSEAV